PILEKAARVSAMFGVEVLPLLFLMSDDSTHPFRNELVLRVEVAVKGHLVGLRGLRDSLYADAADTLLVEKVPGRDENALARPQRLSYRPDGTGTRRRCRRGR